MINHYEYEDLLKLISEINVPHYLIIPDTKSYMSPEVRDWILILSRKPIPRDIQPLPIRIARKLVAGYLKFLQYIYKNKLVLSGG